MAQPAENLTDAHALAGDDAVARDAAQSQIERGLEMAETYLPFTETADFKDPDALHSPAKRLQHYLDTELGSQFGQDAIEGRWSTRRTAAFVVLSSAFLWAMIIVTVKAIT